MFDTYRIDNSYRSPSKIDVTEKRAPTDESVRLLNEMQQKAFDNIVSCVQLDNNELKDITWWIYPDYASFTEKARVRFSLNGKIFDEIITLPCDRTKMEEVPKMILERVVEIIATKVTMKLFEKNLNTFKEIYKRP